MQLTPNNQFKPFARGGAGKASSLFAWMGAGWLRWISQAIAHRRVFVLSPFLVIFGIFAYLQPQTEPALWAALVPLCAALFYSGLCVWRGKSYVLGAIFTSFSVGFALLAVHGGLFGSPLLGRAIFGTYQMHVLSIVREADDGQRIIVGDIQARDGARDIPIRKARVFVRPGADKLLPGMVIEGAMRFAPVPGPPAPGSFDSQFHAYFDGVGSFATATRPPVIVSYQASTGIGAQIGRLRREIGVRLDVHLSGRANAIARALIIGDQAKISQDLRDTMAVAGLAHVLAISGLHLSLVAGGLYFAIRALLALHYGMAQTLPLKKIAALCGAIIALLYLGISGGSVSATRATIMLLLIFGAVLAGRQALTMRNVAFAALGLLIIDPASLFRPGFQLSFAAVVALIGFYEFSQRQERDKQQLAGRLLGYFWGLIVTSAVAGIATVVFAAYHFQQTAPLSLLGNVMALPMVGLVILPAGAIGVLLMPLGLEGVPFLIMGWGIEHVVQVATLIALLSEGLVRSPQLSVWALGIMTAALAWFAFFPSRIRWVGPILVLPLIMAFAIEDVPDILVADSTQAVALRGADGAFGLISGRRKSFVVDVWAETYARPFAPKYSDVQCDDLGCIASGPEGQTIALVRNSAAFSEDCEMAQVVITRLYAPSFCYSTTQVIDAASLRRFGVHRLDWDQDLKVYTTVTAITDPNRAWRPTAR